MKMFSTLFLRVFAGLAVAAAIAVGAALAADAFKPEKIPSPQALVMFKELRGTGQMDLLNLLVARMSVDGATMDVTTLNPAVLVTIGTGEHESGTIVTFSADHKTLIFFTRDLASGDGYRLVLPVTEVGKKPKFSFPSLTPGGAPREATFEMLALLQQK